MLLSKEEQEHLLNWLLYNLRRFENQQDPKVLATYLIKLIMRDAASHVIINTLKEYIGSDKAAEFYDTLKPLLKIRKFEIDSNDFQEPETNNSNESKASQPTERKKRSEVSDKEEDRRKRSTDKSDRKSKKSEKESDSKTHSKKEKKSKHHKTDEEKKHKKSDKEGIPEDEPEEKKRKKRTDDTTDKPTKKSHKSKHRSSSSSSEEETRHHRHRHKHIDSTDSDSEPKHKKHRRKHSEGHSDETEKRHRKSSKEKRDSKDDDREHKRTKYETFPPAEPDESYIRRRSENDDRAKYDSPRKRDKSDDRRQYVRNRDNSLDKSDDRRLYHVTYDNRRRSYRSPRKPTNDKSDSDSHHNSQRLLHINRHYNYQKYHNNYHSKSKQNESKDENETNEDDISKIECDPVEAKRILKEITQISDRYNDGDVAPPRIPPIRYIVCIAGLSPNLNNVGLLFKEFNRFGRILGIQEKHELNCAFIEYEDLEACYRVVNAKHKFFKSEFIKATYANQYDEEMLIAIDNEHTKSVQNAIDRHNQKMKEKLKEDKENLLEKLIKSCEEKIAECESCDNEERSKVLKKEIMELANEIDKLTME
ncbi:hypothetical protein GPJ56_006295 [Histomonas meleagridis]|uniref:uncharacterized protein n=1 Tax=Histomonas meleagridis TaxID=135588 RepID=UPI0035596193|nr:hypothetical protein GPJ56_006295 [Histomonas meleagridis]KAH0796888.1 hypothetical protein GO595_010781 [Histomonas meleagridis]